MNVLSLFDGISAGRLALDRAGVKYNTYYASEIDKYAIKVAMKNYPSTIQIGDVTQVNGWEYPDVGLVIGGSPCQSFSIAGRGEGFDGKSKLFWEYVRILNEVKLINPDVKFLLENVKMKKEWRDVITNALGVEPIEINSALLSAQNRRRLYWTNIPNITQPEDKGLVLRDILEDGCTDREKSFCLDANYNKGVNLEQYFGKGRRQLVFQVNPSTESGGKQPYMQNRIYHPDGKSVALTQFANRLNVLVVGQVNSSQDGKIVSEEGKSPCLTAGNYNMPKVYLNPEQIERAKITHSDKVWKTGKRMGKMKFPVDLNSKSKCVLAGQTTGARETIHIEDEIGYRKLTPVGCERLQTFPDNWTEGISSTQRYKAIGNSWTVDVIAHIFKNLLY
jgi:DNA-cytosine methyltransferase